MKAHYNASHMLMDACKKEQEGKERKLNVVNILLGAALFVGVVALISSLAFMGGR